MTRVTVTRNPWIRHHLVTSSQSSLLSVGVSRSCLPLWKLEIDRSSIFYYDLSASEATCDEEVTRPSFHHRCLWMWRLVTVFATSRDTSAADSRSHGFNTRIVTRERIHKGLLMCMTVVWLINCSEDIFLQNILIKHKKAFSQNKNCKGHVQWILYFYTKQDSPNTNKVPLFVLEGTSFSNCLRCFLKSADQLVAMLSIAVSGGILKQRKTRQQQHNSLSDQPICFGQTHSIRLVSRLVQLQKVVCTFCITCKWFWEN